MTKTKRQLRAEAVERLKANPSDDTFEKIIAAAIGCTPLFITTRQTRDMLIYLLTDNASDDSAPEKVVSDSDVDVTPEKRSKTEQDGLEPSSNLLEPDSREKLEADVEKIVKDGFVTYAEIIELLDRQAAITQSECERICDTCEWPSVAAQPDQEAYDRIAELQAKVDELEREVGYWQWRHIHFLDDYTELDTELGEHERALHRAEHERDEFREKLSRALDLAHEIGMIQP